MIPVLRNLKREQGRMKMAMGEANHDRELIVDRDIYNPNMFTSVWRITI
jgi:hypothetical protein